MSSKASPPESASRNGRYGARCLGRDSTGATVRCHVPYGSQRSCADLSGRTELPVRMNPDLRSGPAQRADRRASDHDKRGAHRARRERQRREVRREERPQRRGAEQRGEWLQRQHRAHLRGLPVVQRLGEGAVGDQRVRGQEGQQPELGGAERGNRAGARRRQHQQRAREVDAHQHELRGQVAQLTQQVEELTAVSRVCVQKVGVVRFRAFEDTGSDLSFAVALLDSDDNGVVLSSLFGRTESRVYAKPVEHGASSYLLSTEENEALSKAKKQTLIN